MFAFIHSAQENGWQLVGNAITIHTNPFSAQREQKDIISLSDSDLEI